MPQALPTCSLCPTPEICGPVHSCKFGAAGGVKPPPTLLDLKPADTPDIMAPAWVACVLWAASEPEIVERFRVDTGSKWLPPQNAFERMIDEATGANWGLVEKFTKWVNVNIWGPIDGPPEEKDRT